MAQVLVKKADKDTEVFGSFEWSRAKNAMNMAKHGIDFKDAIYAFADEDRLIYDDLRHSTPEEKRFFCLGLVHSEVITVCFCLRGTKIRIFSAGKRRKDRQEYMLRRGK